MTRREQYTTQAGVSHTVDVLVVDLSEDRVLEHLDSLVCHLEGRVLAGDVILYHTKANAFTLIIISESRIDDS